MADIIVVLLLILAVGAAIIYLKKQKKKGSGCMGCPYSGSCGGNCNHTKE
ncbi:MAG: FeoB-associated Cys-rich membrane protein [Eubacteriales bacterium]|nr:FeoB-associated Cys-rich membrane protein [Eubacteriales bacterium]